MKLNGFDRIASVYDFLAKLVFGKGIVDSQKYFLDRIHSHSKILILGGGSGWLLAELLKRKPKCEVWYIEASQKMIGFSKSKIDFIHKVHFIHGTEQDIPSCEQFDVLITNFYLDLFTDQQLLNVVAKLKLVMQPGSQWIVADFVNHGKWWQKAMLKVMYSFFTITCNIESRRLPEWNRAIEQAGARKVDSTTFYRGFIKTALHQF